MSNNLKLRVVIGVGGIAIALFTSLCSAQATAQKRWPIDIENWTAIISLDERTKKFTHCSATMTNSRGVSMTYTVNRDYAWSLTFSKSDWDFSRGYSLSLRLKINDRSYSNERALFSQKNVLHVQLRDKLEFFEALRSSGKLEVYTGGTTIDFNLSTSNAALAALVRCVGQQTKRSHRGASSTQKSLKANDRATDVETAAEAAALATQLISYSGIADSKIRTTTNGPAGELGDVTWKNGLVVGNVGILSSSQLAKLDDLAVMLVTRDMMRCPGALFAASASDVLDRTGVMRVMTNCQTLEGTVSKYYLGLPRTKGGHYLIGTSTDGFESPLVIHRPAKDMDVKIRSVVMKALSSFQTAAEKAAE